MNNSEFEQAMHFVASIVTCKYILWEEVPVNGLFQEILGSELYIKIGPITYKKIGSDRTMHTTCKRVYFRGMA